MLEEIRTQQLERIQIKGQWVKNYDFPVPPVIKEIIDKAAAESTSWRSLWNGEHEYQVTGPYGQFVVNLQTKKCTCRLWQLRGIPCVHAAASILKIDDSITDYVSEYYSRIRMTALYEHVLYPINGMENWPRSSEVGFELVPPNTKRQRGRPRKVRREQNQVQYRENGVEELMRSTLITCSRCGQIGHNRRTCQNDPRPPTPTSQRSGASSSQPQSGAGPSSSRSTAAPRVAPAKQAPAAGRGQPTQGTAGAAGPPRPISVTRRAQRCGRRRNAD
ncbi:uncharacterized protein LOC125208875 [Salvia hispanica]|uniref:uncharacterized protein LOC125208875 n=1 Tax=Salvia hispanica TaxID=49212 RepID=UPI0020094977|nr:uncharacterized protein LOC125208875 [Salvia hispanica]